MGIVVTPYSPNSTQTPFADLSQQQRLLVTGRLAMILERSFVTDETRLGKAHRQKVHTQAEERRRGMIMMRWFRVMRCDLGYSVQKALDLIPKALRTELDGGTYEPPPKNRLWSPEGVLA